MRDSSWHSLAAGVVLGLLLVGLTLGVLYLRGYRFMAHPAAPAPGSGQKLLCYVSPSDPSYYRLEPGKDPQGQDLIPVYVPDTSVPASPPPPSGQRRIKYWVSPMDPGYVRDKPGKAPCGMDLVPVYEDEATEAGGTITVSPETLQTLGVRTAQVEVQPLTRTIRALSRVTFDERALSQVSTKINGWVEKLNVKVTGEGVRRGQVLVQLYSPELVATQREYLLAWQHWQQVQHSPIADVREGARRLLDASRQRLLFWDIPASQIEALAASGAISRTLPLLSPVTGIVIKREVTEGQYVSAGQTILQVVDLSRVWVEADVYEYELPWLKVGQPAQLTLPYLPGQVFTGRVEYIYPYLQNVTRTARLRLSFTNPRLQLKPEMYGQVEIKVALGQATPTVPTEAVLDTGAKQHVFLALGQGRFAPREIKVGLQGDDGRVQVLAGLHGGEEVVTSAQFLLDSEARFREAVAQMLGEAKPTGSKTPDKPMPHPPGHHQH